MESGYADISISGQEVMIQVELQEALVVSIDSGAVIFNVDPEVQFGQNWVGSGADASAVAQKTNVNVSTNNANGYSLRVALSGNTAT